MTLPNFFIIGAQKAGTTSLYHYLAQHPEVYMSPVKEPYFFDHEIGSDGELVFPESRDRNRQRTHKYPSIEEYRGLFSGVEAETAIGEASTPYIYVPGTAERIKRYAPQAKVIAVLRNPAERAYSAFLHAIRIGMEPLTDFAQALREEEKRVIEDSHPTLHYRNRGFYFRQLERYYGVFGQKQVGVWLYEDLKDDPEGTLQDIFRFLGVDDAFVPDTSSKHNRAGVPRGGVARATVKAMDIAASAFLEKFTSASRLYPFLSKMRQFIQGRIVVKPPPLDQRIRAELLEGYRDDVLNLQGLIGRDLSAWLKDEKRDRAREVGTTERSG